MYHQPLSLCDISLARSDTLLRPLHNPTLPLAFLFLLLFLCPAVQSVSLPAFLSLLCFWFLFCSVLVLFFLFFFSCFFFFFFFFFLSGFGLFKAHKTPFPLLLLCQSRSSGSSHPGGHQFAFRRHDIDPSYNFPLMQAAVLLDFSLSLFSSLPFFCLVSFSSSCFSRERDMYGSYERHWVFLLVKEFGKRRMVIGTVGVHA